MPIIRRNNCAFATLGTCYSAWVTGMQGGIPPCIPDARPHTITSTKCRKNSCFSWWWAHSSPETCRDW